MTSAREQPVILADISARVEFDRATGGPADLRVFELIGNDGPPAVTEPVIMEMLARARVGRRKNDLRRLLLCGSGCSAAKPRSTSMRRHGSGGRSGPARHLAG